MTSTLRVPVRYLQAADDDDFDEDDPPWRFSGIAVGPGDVLHMEDGTPVLFKADELQDAADSQSGEPLTADHPQDEFGRPEYPPSTDDTYGKVEKSGYIDGKGVGYEAITHDPELARGIYAGTYEVSIHPRFKADQTDDETGLLMAEDVEFLDLSVVSKGDSPSNTANWGPSQELAAWVHAALNDADPNGAEASASAGEGDEESAPEKRGFLQTMADVLGVDADLTADDTETAPAGEQGDDEPAESGATPSDTMDNNDKIQTLVSEHDFNEESLEAMSEEDLDRLYESVAEADPDGGGGGGDGSQDSNTTTVEADIGDHDSFEDYLDELVAERVDEAEANREQADLVDEIIAHSDSFDEDDREELMSSARPVVEKLHEDATASTASRLPGATGRGQQVTASAGGGDSEKFEEIVGQLNGDGTGGD